MLDIVLTAYGPERVTEKINKLLSTAVWNQLELFCEKSSLVNSRVFPPHFGTPASMESFTAKKRPYAYGRKMSPHHRHKILVAGIVGIRAETVRCVPRSFFNRFDIFELRYEILSLKMYSLWVEELYYCVMATSVSRPSWYSRVHPQSLVRKSGQGRER
jgi:hypothetical protein